MSVISSFILVTEENLIPHNIDNFPEVRFLSVVTAGRLSTNFPPPEGLVMDGAEQLPSGTLITSPGMPCLKEINLSEG